MPAKLRNMGEACTAANRFIVHAAGAVAVTGGAPVEGPGYFYRPTVLTGVSEGTRILSEEIFGPVAPITTCTTEDEAVRLANNTDYGLVALHLHHGPEPRHPHGRAARDRHRQAPYAG